MNSPDTAVHSPEMNETTPYLEDYVNDLARTNSPLDPREWHPDRRIYRLPLSFDNLPNPGLSSYRFNDQALHRKIESAKELCLNLRAINSPVSQERMGSLLARAGLSLDSRLNYTCEDYPYIPLLHDILGYEYPGCRDFYEDPSSHESKHNLQIVINALNSSAWQNEMLKRETFNQIRFSKKVGGIENLAIPGYSEIPPSIDKLIGMIANELDIEKGSGQSALVHELYNAALVILNENASLDILGESQTDRSQVYPSKLHELAEIVRTYLQLRLEAIETIDIGALNLAIYFIDAKREHEQSIRQIDPHYKPLSYEFDLDSVTVGMGVIMEKFAISSLEISGRLKELFSSMLQTRHGDDDSYFDLCAAVIRLLIDKYTRGKKPVTSEQVAERIQKSFLGKERFALPMFPDRREEDTRRIMRSDTYTSSDLGD
ncbi:hypothetical protein H6763_03780 [Candidatus Nomurabacteria bacterium]|uniref:Uncharacterized protein n=1 Tax=Candidatus Dojkabacteria bacterium TaxID=2099670 RepID=A0A955KYG3_9BACT|nr:hypothetical protein [Candidatus Dojkabacteria bacterium]MCB9789605.1 hypothetical protein [Candidatus Nomurabacteria bacterium]MCB9803925.1 hypothetical protein [Candidatus Nomurabacteria bacterium]